MSSASQSIHADWYDTPAYYDIIFDQDTEREAIFLEAVVHKHGSGTHPACLHVLEPACGSGRLMLALAQRGHGVWGFDRNPNMVQHSSERMMLHGYAAVCWQDCMEIFAVPKAPVFDLAHCLVSTFKYLLRHEDACAHLRHVAACLREGGLYVLGIHLTNYDEPRAHHERWVGVRDGVRVTCNTHTWPADRKARTENLRTRLRIARDDREFLQETNWTFRTYNAAQVRGLLRSVPELKLVECYDFTYNLDAPRKLDDSYADIILVLRKQAPGC
ncbi:MAG: class I SAM-dependent methyltransferase [Roseimicrobium sp.]